MHPYHVMPTASWSLKSLLLMIAVVAVCGLCEAQAVSPQDAWIEFRSFEYRGEDSLSTPAVASAREYRNPILAGFYPDPSVLRVGEDYYLVNSSFAWFPGVPIFHSRDLVHWRQIGHVLDRPEQLQLDGAGVSRGIFAPAIQFHAGKYYMITTNIDGVGNFYVTATNPAGPWSNPVALPEIDGIDPSFFFDNDGKGYIVHNGPPEGTPLYDGHRALWLFPFDVKAGKVSGPGRIIVNGGTDLAKQPIWIEGPHIFRKDGFYYLIAAEGGTAEGHSEVVFRSKAVEGPYEPYKGNPILTQRDLPNSRPDPITSTGHADFVETHNGEWWAVFLGCEPYKDEFYNTGRQTFLLPVKWIDGWPVVLEKGTAVPRLEQQPKLPHFSAPPMTGAFEWKADFTQDRLPYEFNTLRTPTRKWWATRNGSLLIEPRPEDLDTKHDPSLIARRQQHAVFSATVEMRVATSGGPSDAGLVAFQNETHSYFLGVRFGHKTPPRIFLEKRDGGVAEVAATSLAGSVKSIQLKIEGKRDRYRFFYRHGAAEEWRQLGGDQDGTILSTRVAGGFVGTYVGMFARTRNRH